MPPGRSTTALRLFVPFPAAANPPASSCAYPAQTSTLIWPWRHRSPPAWTASSASWSSRRPPSMPIPARPLLCRTPWPPPPGYSRKARWRVVGWAMSLSTTMPLPANGKFGNSTRRSPIGSWRDISNRCNQRQTQSVQSAPLCYFDLFMDLSTFSFPTTIVFGAGSAGRLPDELKKRDVRRPLLVTDAGIERTAIFERIRKPVPEAAVFSKVEPNPVEQNVLDGVAAYRNSGCDGVIALGGGSPLDAAKAIR